MKSTINNLKHKLSDLQDSTKNLSSTAVSNILDNSTINESQKIVINEIINASKVKPKGRRYSDNWILLCIILNIR